MPHAEAGAVCLHSWSGAVLIEDIVGASMNLTSILIQTLSVSGCGDCEVQLA